MYERSLGPQSKWFQYLQILPSREPIPLLWSLPEIDSLLCGTEIHKPGTAWRDVLISSGHVGWLLNLYGVLRQKFSSEGYWLDCPLAVSARRLVVQFCSFSGTIFPSDNGYTQRRLLLQLLAGILPWVEPPDAVSKVIECGNSERPHGTLGLLSDLTCEVIKDLVRNQAEEEAWSWVARDILLDIWTALLMQLDGGGHLESLPPEGIIAAGNLFMLIVESELKAALHLPSVMRMDMITLVFYNSAFELKKLTHTQVSRSS